MSKIEARRDKCGIKFDQIYADKFKAQGLNLKNAANLTPPPKGKFK